MKPWRVTPSGSKESGVINDFGGGANDLDRGDAVFHRRRPGVHLTVANDLAIVGFQIPGAGGSITAWIGRVQIFDSKAELFVLPEAGAVQQRHHQVVGSPEVGEHLIAKTQLLLIDDWGLEALTAAQRNNLMEIMDDRHSAASTVMISQLPTDQWYAAIGDNTQADAILDRLMHNAHRLPLKGESMRKIYGQLTEDEHLGYKPGNVMRWEIRCSRSAGIAVQLRRNTQLTAFIAPLSTLAYNYNVVIL